MSEATASPAIPEDIAKLSFEEALGQLETLVRQLEQGQVGLDDAIASYETRCSAETPLRGQTARG